MSHQLVFLATPADLAEFEPRIRGTEGISCLAWRSPTESPVLKDHFFKYTPGRDDLTVFLARTAPVTAVLTRPVPAQGYWVVDGLRSPVIEVSRCFVSAEGIRPGRLYYTDGYYGEDGLWIEKPDLFRKWAATVLQTARKFFRRSDSTYVGSEAASMAVLPE